MKLKSFSLYFGEQIFKALSDESRIRIIHLLFKNGEMCISDIEQILDFTQTKTSRHVGYLKNAGLLNQKKIDQWIYYSVREEVSGVISQMLSFIEKDEALVEDQKNYNTLYANNILAVRKLHNRQNKYRAGYA